jgi:hypothetical protein
MHEKQAVARQVRCRYQKAGRKEKSAILDEFIKTTGYKNRKYAPRVLNRREPTEALLVVNGKTVKLKPPKKRPANRKGKKIYTDEVIASLRLIWDFFWCKCGRTEGPQLLAPLMRQQMSYIALWPVFGITPEIREKLMRISPRARFRGETIDRALKKDRAALALRGKSLTKPGELLKHRIPIRTFYTSQERKLPGFIQIDTVTGHLRPIYPHPHRHRCRFRLDMPVFPAQQGPPLDLRCPQGHPCGPALPPAGVPQR